MMLVLASSIYVVDTTQSAPAGTDDPQHHHVTEPDITRAALAAPTVVPRIGWTVTVDSQQTSAGTVGSNALDGDNSTLWHTQWTPTATPLPHWILIDMHASRAIAGLTYQPRPAATGKNGNIGRYRVEVSPDGSSFTTVATGTFADDSTMKTVAFGTQVTRFVRLTALTEAGNRGPWTNAAEINLLAGTDPALPRDGWTVSVDSEETSTSNPVTNVLDGSTDTIWHTQWTPTAAPLPHQVTLDTHTSQLVGGLVYVPRPAYSGKNGNIGRYRVDTSPNGTTWTTAASGTFADDNTTKTVTFTPVQAEFVRLVALSEAGNRGPWTSAAEINLLSDTGATLPRTGWTASADSEDVVNSVRGPRTLDGDTDSIWHTQWTPTATPLPHAITVDMHATHVVSGLAYLPRPPASGKNGNIGQYRVDASPDGTTWTTVDSGTFADDNFAKTVTFAPVRVEFVRLVALTEAGNRGPWTSAAEINLLGPDTTNDPSRGRWSAPIGFPLVPVAAAVLPNGKVLTWSSYAPDTYGGTGKTVTATFDPATGVVSQRTVTETGHDMFCPGISTLSDGSVLVTGGDDSTKASLYNPKTDTWTAVGPMTLGRGYQGQVTLSDGRAFVIGGSWSGGQGGKNGEVYQPGGGWTGLPNAPVAPMLTADDAGVYRQDNHGWLFAWTGGTVFQAGPSKAMNWYDSSTSTGGGTHPAGARSDDGDAMNGNAVMYDAGKILTVGGAPSYSNSTATTNAYVVEIDNGVTVTKVSPMTYKRAFTNSVVLPDGKVLVVGGEDYAVPFSDNGAVLTPELWDPATQQFTVMAPQVVPRTYHSVALLLPDGRVLSGGGGLCASCGTNHFDAEIFTPPNLLKPDGTLASRPAIISAPGTAGYGATVTVATDRTVSAFSIVRLGTATHSLDTDQRRIGLTPTSLGGNSYSLSIPSDSGVAPPGYYMLFALDSYGVPSVASMLKIG